MRCLLAVAFAVLAVAPAFAQEPKRLKTIRVQEPAPGGRDLFVIEDDGTVRIDWKKVEQASTADNVILPVAQLMLAIRDGTWKPMK